MIDTKQNRINRKHIARCMKELDDMTQTDLAEKLGVGQAHVSRLLNGERKVYTSHILAVECLVWRAGLTPPYRKS